MSPRRLLIITYHFPPSAAVGGHRLLGFVRHLPDHGWSCSVVAPRELPWEPTDSGLLKRVPEGTTVYRSSYPTGRLSKPMRWLAPYASWLPAGLASCARAIREQRFDAVLTSGPPHVVHLLGLWLRRRHRLAWVADFRDPWASGDLSIADNPAGFWDRRWERAVVRQASAVVLTTPRARDGLAAQYPHHASKMVAISNGYDPEMFASVADRPRGAGPHEIVHSGQIYARRDPGPFFEGLRALAEVRLPGIPELRARFIGCKGERAALVGTMARQAGIEDLVIVDGHLPHRDAIAATCRADVLLLLDTPNRLSGVPAKLYEYLGSGKPILALAEAGSDVEWVLRRSGACFRMTPPKDPQAVRIALEELIREQLELPDSPRREAFSAPFTRAALSEELAELLDGCIGKASESRDTAVPGARETTR